QQKGFKAEKVKENIERSLRQERGLEKGNEDFTVSTPQDILSSFQSVLGIVQAIVVGIASISLLVGGVGIMNTMYTAVKERTREIGVMKAVGAEDHQILVLFLLESGLIGLVGGLVGVITGLGISKGFVFAARQYSALPLEAAVSWELVAGALLFAFLVGAVSGVMPARNAAKLDPADALRYE
ncbi:MAG: ABC transporter permease, partial [Candidatus Nanohaloarchaea archaeon]|nr:ABC transporter permease [Candidatus Nanohaloarchaea archaeon]